MQVRTAYKISDENNISVQQVPEEIQQAMEMQIPALDAYCELKSNLEAMPTSFMIEELYAGEYIDEDKLVIQLVDATTSDMEYYRGLTGNSNDVLSYGLDIKNNRYMMTVSGDDYNSLIEDEAVLENQGAIFIENGGDSRAVTCASTLYGGDRISRESSSMDNSYMSMCIGGTYNDKNAILTAGHNNEGSPNYYRNGNLVGSVSYQRCNTVVGDTGVNSLGDFAIITLSSSFNPSNYVRNATSTVPITGTYSSLPVGTTIYKYGSRTGYSWGSVTYTDITVNYKDVFGFTTYQVRGLYQSSLQNSSSTDAINSGDSGGCVYIKDGNSYKIHGLVSGMLSSSSINSIMYSSPIYYAVDAGFSPKLE